MVRARPGCPPSLVAGGARAWSSERAAAALRAARRAKWAARLIRLHCFRDMQLMAFATSALDS